MSRKWLEAAFILTGSGCLASVGMSLVDAAHFQRATAQTLDRELTTRAQHALPEAVDPRLIGRLEIPRLEVSLIVMEGDDEATLAVAAGHVPGTAFPWESSNAVIAGHRDTFFRPLRGIREGDEIRMTTALGTFDYRVIGTEVVEPDDVSVLAPTPTKSLTLVTCYPFVYVGAAPRRFIVHAQ